MKYITFKLDITINSNYINDLRGSVVWECAACSGGILFLGVCLVHLISVYSATVYFATEYTGDMKILKPLSSPRNAE